VKPSHDLLGQNRHLGPCCLRVRSKAEGSERCCQSAPPITDREGRRHDAVEQAQIEGQFPYTHRAKRAECLACRLHIRSALITPRRPLTSHSGSAMMTRSRKNAVGERSSDKLASLGLIVCHPAKRMCDQHHSVCQLQAPVLVWVEV